MDVYKCGYCLEALGTLEEYGITEEKHECLKLFSVINADEINKILVGGEESMESPTTDKWKDSETKLLISLYGKHRAKFTSPAYNKRQVWKDISAELSQNNAKKDSRKCEQKWRNLTKTYKKIKDTMAQTGKDKKSWQFFESMDNLLQKDPQYSPVATISSSYRSSSSRETESSSSRESTPGPSSITRNEKPQKRKAIDVLEIEANRERRHKEKLEQKERFFKWFQETFKPE